MASRARRAGLELRHELPVLPRLLCQHIREELPVLSFLLVPFFQCRNLVLEEFPVVRVLLLQRVQQQLQLLLEERLLVGSLPMAPLQDRP